jgi:acetyl-CoA C-acetyltransferase
MKSVMLAAQYQCSDAEIVVAGGMENMSLIPHYMNLRNGTNLVLLPWLMECKRMD